MMTFHKTPTFRRTLLGSGVLLLLAALTLTGYAQQKPIPPRKAKLIGYTEDFLMNNFRDVTMRKSLEWGDVKTDDKGNSTIRYRCEALIGDKDRMTLAWDFTFDKDGKYAGHKTIEKVPVKDDAFKTARAKLDDLVWDVLGFRYTSMSKDNYQRVVGQHLKNHPNGGIVIETVREGSQFAEKGIKPGDIIIGIHEWVTTSQNDVQYIAKSWQSIPSSTETVEIRCFRNGQLYFTEIPLNIDENKVISPEAEPNNEDKKKGAKNSG